MTRLAVRFEIFDNLMTSSASVTPSIPNSGTDETPARNFRQTVIKIGRDPDTCRVVFDSVRWSMVVSRNHAERRKRQDGLTVRDCGSSLRTFLDDERCALIRFQLI